MCRWLAYCGSPILLEELLFKAEHSLIDQSMSSKSVDTPTNADGFGVGWYGNRKKPGVFRSIRPAWNDFNLRDLSAQIESRLFMAHVRAASLATVLETNCHPFRYGRWLFVHNGEIDGFQEFHRDLLFDIAPELFPHVQGTTDSEVLFYLAVTFGLEEDPIGALERAAGLVEQVAAQHGVAKSLWMTLGVTNGESMFAVRYASDGDAPTLYQTDDAEHLYRLNKALRGYHSGAIRLIVSEPIGNVTQQWTEIAQNTAVTFHDGGLSTHPFQPQAPA